MKKNQELENRILQLVSELLLKIMSEHKPICGCVGVRVCVCVCVCGGGGGDLEVCITLLLSLFFLQCLKVQLLQSGHPTKSHAN